ncbi:alpha/beta-hydrolase [Guyanagaster necrorhizus]|uniref:Alpha/beta-hydrolase n=1 Tax=Guyanagaster necrorhizus TaxID=856835 RepID=A0A9P7VX21_9AGAR|nr:alpha/beta-hydrolase [Guyanagaster necrorhizus MCA 3950]KAG7448137.1 alpha/beta-hydrolase [Guyanagaster necrorhizus MCA 3950]
MHIDLSTGISLEAELTSPSDADRNHGDGGSNLAIFLHPWSWLGGRMQDPVVSLLMDIFEAHKSHYYLLRYNSRGVGKSSGWPSLTGLSEGEDLRALVQWALGTLGNIRSLVIVGYSHGSLIASLHSTLPSKSIKVSHILLSYPLGPRGWLTAFHSNTYDTALRNLLSSPDAHVLVVFGDQDDFTGVSKYERWTEELRRLAGTDAQRLEIVRVDGASHFWRGQDEQVLAAAVERWLQG